MKGSITHRTLVLAVIACASAAPATAQSKSPAVDRSVVQPIAGGIIPVEGAGDVEWTAWTGGRYRLTPGDTIDVTFPFVPELNQRVPVLPDGYVNLKDVPEDIHVQGLTLAEAKQRIFEAYEPYVREPVLTLALQEFEKPYFVASGEVENPGRYELRGATTVTQALAFAGGPTGFANISHVVLYRRYGVDRVEVKQIDVKHMYAKKDLSEDPVLRPGDTIVVPKSVFGKVSPLLDFFRFRIW